MTAIADRLNELEREINAAADACDARKATAGWRSVLEFYWDESNRRSDPEPGAAEPEYARLWEEARRAMAALGGEGEPTLRTLADYDHRRHGPALGVSDEGSATAAIRQGALTAPKCAATGTTDPLVVGVAHDAERLGAVGEVVVGPDEYADIRLACRNRLLTTTNVGTRVNVRHFLAPPTVLVPPGAAASAAATVTAISRHFAPYLRTPSGRARSVTVFARFGRKVSSRARRAILDQLQGAVAAGTICQPKRHRLGLLVELARGGDRVDQALAGIDLACQCNVTTIAFDGPVLAAAREAISLPGLLNHFEPAELTEILRYTGGKKLAVGARLRVDPQTTARHVWTGLSVARNMGFNLGKYGLVPLTLEEQKEVVARIQYWFPHWCAAPVCYVDYPIVTATEAFHGPRLAAGIRRWLEMVAKLGVRVVLIDTAKKAEGWKLLKDSADDERGLLLLREIASLNTFALSKGIKVLWAGGITLPQAYEFGRLGVFGIYVTSAAASIVPVNRHYRRDPYLIASREPQREAVARVKLLMEAGFHVGRMEAAGARELAAPIADGARALLAALAAADEAAGQQKEADLYPLVVQAWKEHLSAARP